MTYEDNCKIDKDHIATPEWLVTRIFDLIDIKSFYRIWFPFDNYDSEFKLKADRLGLNYTATHKFDRCGNDFFTTNPPKYCELMISNPPFSQQNKILERTFKLIDDGLIKSFALLLPLSTLETPFRAKLYEQYKNKISIIVLKHRVKFKGQKNSFNKALCWICYNIPSLQKLMWM